MTHPQAVNRTLRQQTTAFLEAKQPRLLILDVGHSGLLSDMATDVAAGLADPTGRGIPPTYFYDSVGSEIYEAITALPEYYPTRTEAALLDRVAPELATWMRPADIVELGSGSSAKTRLLFDAWGAEDHPLVYVPVDISRTMLAATADRLCEQYPAMRILGLAGPFEGAFDVLAPRGDRLVLFLGGTLGNFTAEDQHRFFERLAAVLAPGSHFLLGFDRQAHPRKPVDLIEAAYNDAAGVTARFNLNLLVRLNRELGADFALDAWAHRAVYNQELHQIEMYLESLADQTVTVPSIGRFDFKQGDRILTELSRKFDPEGLSTRLESYGFEQRAVWSDEAELFGMLLLRKR